MNLSTKKLSHFPTSSSFSLILLLALGILLGLNQGCGVSLDEDNVLFSCAIPDETNSSGECLSGFVCRDLRDSLYPEVQGTLVCQPCTLDRGKPPTQIVHSACEADQEEEILGSVVLSGTCELDANTVSQKTLKLVGNMGGAYSFDFSVSGKTITLFDILNLESEKPPQPGEEMRVLLDANIKSTSKAKFSTFQWHWFSPASDGTGDFEENNAPPGELNAFEEEEETIYIDIEHAEDLQVEDLQVGDFNLDGYLDLMVSSSGEIIVYLQEFRDEEPIYSENSSTGEESHCFTNPSGPIEVFDDRTGEIISSEEPPFLICFTKTESVVVGNLSTKFQLGDLDGDGDLDAFVLTPYSPDSTSQDSGLFSTESIPATVLINDGTGHFSPHLFSLQSSIDPISLDLGDCDGDGDLDALMVFPQEPAILWINDGDGDFSAQQRLSSGSTQYNGGGLSGAFGDLDRDGDLDIIIGSAEESAGNRIWVNRGDGNFIDSQRFFGGKNNQEIIIADINNDGFEDVFIARNEQGSQVWLGDGTGGWSSSDQASETFQASNPSLSAALGDLNSDGLLDIVLANGSLENTVHLNLGGGFSAPQSLRQAGDDTQGHHAVDLGDIDGDGSIDLIFATENGITIRRNESKDSDEAENPSLNPINSLSFPTSIDPDDSIRVWLNRDYRTIFDCEGPPPEPGKPPEEPSGVDCGRDNEIGHRLFKIRGEWQGIYEGKYVFDSKSTLGQIKITFTPSMPFLPGERLTLSAPRVDLQELSNSPPSPAGPSVPNSITVAKIWSIQVNTPTVPGWTYSNLKEAERDFFHCGENFYQNLDDFITSPAGMSQDVALGHLNGDEYLDAITVNTNSTVSIWVGSPSGIRLTQVFTLNGITGVSLGPLQDQFLLEDDCATPPCDALNIPNARRLDAIFYGDGIKSVWLNSTSKELDEDTRLILEGCSNSDTDLLDCLSPDESVAPSCPVPNTPVSTILTFSHNFGLTDEQAEQLPSNGHTPEKARTRAIALEDLDSDGHIDAFVANETQGNTIWLGDGAGNFHHQLQFLGNNPSQDVKLADFDQDGSLDAFVANDGTAGSSVWFNDGSAGFISCNTSSAGKFLGESSSKGVVLGDIISGDEGAPEALLGNFGENKFWYRDLDTQEFEEDSSELIFPGQKIADTWDVDLGDLDGDGSPDLVTVNNDGSVEIWNYKAAEGSFSLSILASGGSERLPTRGVKLGDLNGDGRLDIFTTQSAPPSEDAVLPNNVLYLNH